ncbi:hypothetical protein BJF85_06325 [Saccharomonospora sp. CUA-673]|uniref:sigma-70 family RNA polymerase sigma factor n=1 Tax=Saccharomonospora sp. CUA-673 TaxID=1904969 RepID=UPI000962013E|nr:sigma-70 family RNA polymerase sigma factor [Saccharomonospora sp. CUA-673]OLT39970.1 hypothetical protein BJF85_06325 [Saccharomonospora sp. CUA-673]
MHAAELADRFQRARPRLLSMAHRMLGSYQDAEDAVQTTWLRVQATRGDRAGESGATGEIANVDGWFTTITSRICLDQLRARQRRGETSLQAVWPSGEVGPDRLGADRMSAEQMATDEEFLRREDVSRALVVLLGELSANQRVAYVLHDLFAVPFDDVAAVLDTSRDAAKKLASRARLAVRDARVGGAADPDSGSDDMRDAAGVVEAFLAAARDGDLDRLVAMLAPDAVRTADRSLLPPAGATEVRGARAIADETRFFAERIAVTAPVWIDGRPAAVIAPGGRPYAVITFTVRAGLVAAFAIEPYRPGVLSAGGE